MGGYASLILFADDIFSSCFVWTSGFDGPGGRVNISKCILNGTDVSVGSSSAHVDSSVIIGHIYVDGYGPPYVNVYNSTLVGDSAIHSRSTMVNVSLTNCIIKTNGGPAIISGIDFNRFSLSCCDIFDYSGANWIEGIPERADTSNIFHQDPLFCWPAKEDYTLQNSSPRLPANNSCGVLLGAYGEGCPAFITGNVNGDTVVSVSDVVYLVNYLFKGGPVPLPVVQAGDANCNGKVTISDAVYLINYLFKGGLPPCS